MTKGFIVNVVTSPNGIMLNFLRLFSIGVVGGSDEYGKVTTLVIGIWRFFTSITLEYKEIREVDGRNAGIS
tara:strand:+ start:1631 stop:1843 length:213 start_codon:yes stop_codon:yes gene_type:complete